MNLYKVLFFNLQYLPIASTFAPDVMVSVLNSSSILINWSVPSDSDIKGFIVVINGTGDKYNASTFQTEVTDLIPGSAYNICVFAYGDLLSLPNITMVQLPLSMFLADLVERLNYSSLVSRCIILECTENQFSQ